MHMKSKFDYETPSIQILFLNTEGVICGSYQMNFGEPNQSGSISDDDILGPSSAIMILGIPFTPLTHSHLSITYCCKNCN